MPHDPSSPPWVIPWNSEGLSNESVRRSVELASMAFDERFEAPDPRALRHDLRDRDTPRLRRRRAIVGLSLIGLAGTALASLCQMGVLRHLSGPPLRRFFYGDTTTPSPAAYQHGLPDAMLSLAAHAGNILFAGLGPEARASRTPWVPLMAAGKAAADAGMAARYFGNLLSEPGARRSWSGYAVVDAAARFGTFVLAIPEAVEAVRYALVAQPAERRSR
jgi:hypothetical protein